MKRILVALFVTLALPISVTAADHIVVLLDTSGSMDERLNSGSVTRMKAAQTALVSVAGKLPDGTVIGLLTFDGWKYELSPLDRGRFIAAVQGCRASGGTPLGQFMKSGADALLQAREKGKGYGTYKLLVVTDGAATDQNLLDKYLPDIASRGLTLDSIGVDMGSDHAISKKSRRYMNANDPESLNKAVTNSLAEFSGTQDSLGDFDMLNGLEPDAAKVIIACVTDYANQPIGEQRVAKIVDPTGKTVEVQANIPAQAPGFPPLGFVCVGGLAFLAIMALFGILNKR